MTPRRPLDDAQEAAFDDALGRAARSLVLASLPPGILDVEPAASARPFGRRLEGWLPAVAAGALLVAVLGLNVLRGGLLPGAGQQPEAGLRGLRAVIGELATTGYACEIAFLGTPGPSVSSGYVCVMPQRLAPVAGVVVLEALPDGSLAAVTVKTDAIAQGSAGVEARRAAAAILRELGASFFADSRNGIAARDWIDASLATMSAGGEARTTIGGVDLDLSVDSLARYHLRATSIRH